MKFSAVAVAMVALCGRSPLASAAYNGRCSNGSEGICTSTSTCSRYGGASRSGYCPNDPYHVRCCDDIPCSSGGRTGTCEFTSDCTGEVVSGLCPGGSNFKCCLPKQNTPGYSSCSYAGYSGECKSQSACDGFFIHNACPGSASIKCCLPGERGEISPGGCQSRNAIEKSNTIVANTCTTRWSTYGGGTSDHSKCRASDIWPPSAKHSCAPGAAEYVMNNYRALDVQYVIYGQRIWNPSVDKSPKPWSQWRQMADRGSITQNHWDHLHVSFNS